MILSKENKNTISEMSKIRTSVTRCLERPRHASYKRRWNQETGEVGEKEPVPECRRGVLAQGGSAQSWRSPAAGQTGGEPETCSHRAGEFKGLEHGDPEGPDGGISLPLRKHQLVYEVGTPSVVTPNKDFNME